MKDIFLVSLSNSVVHGVTSCLIKINIIKHMVSLLWYTQYEAPLTSGTALV